MHLSVMNGPAPVVGLLLGGSPSAIGRFIVPIVVNAVDAQPVRALAHIGKEVPEGAPSLADRDTTSAVEMIVPRVGVSAAAEYRGPALVCTARAPLLGVSVDAVCITDASASIGGRCVPGQASADRGALLRRQGSARQTCSHLGDRFGRTWHAEPIAASLGADHGVGIDAFEVSLHLGKMLGASCVDASGHDGTSRNIETRNPMVSSIHQ